MQSYFLSCSGNNYLIESGNEFKLHKLEKITKTYEIRDKNLYIAIPDGKGVFINPTNYGEHEILYFMEKHPVYSFLNKIYIRINRITGEIQETHNQSSTKITFRGDCTILRKKKF